MVILMIDVVIQNFSISDDITLRQQQNILRRVSFVDGIMTANDCIKRSGIIARAYYDGLWGVATSSTINERSAKELLDKSMNNAKLLSSFSTSNKKRTYLPYSEQSIPAVDFLQIDYIDIEQSIIIDYAKKIDQYISRTYKKICTRRVMLYVDGIEKYIRTPFKNLLLSSTIKRSCLYVEMGAYDLKGHITSVSKKIGVPYEMGKWHTLIENSKELTEQLYEALMDKTHAQDVCKGVFPCILHPNVAGILAHEAIGHNVEADIVEKGSFASGFLGKQIASEKVSISDFAHTAFSAPAGLPLFVDDEGTVCRDVDIIKGGKLLGYLHDRESAAHYQVTPSGNSRAYLAFDEPIIRMRNTAFHPGNDTLADMIASIDNGYFLLSSGGGQADVNGEFIFTIDLGYQIRNGKILGAIRDTTISGNAIEILSSISMISNDFQWDITGLCGKFQSMILATGGPYIKCDLFLGKE